MGYGEEGIRTTSCRQLEAPEQMSGVRNLNMTGQCIVSMDRIDSMMIIQDREDLIHWIIMGLVIHISIKITNKLEEESLNDKTNMDIMITTKTSLEGEEIKSWKTLTGIEKEDMIIKINCLIDIRWIGGDSLDITNIPENIQGTIRYIEIATINGLIDIRWIGRDSLDTTNIPGTICHLETVILDTTIILGVPVRESLTVPQLIEVIVNQINHLVEREKRTFITLQRVVEGRMAYPNLVGIPRTIRRGMIGTDRAVRKQPPVTKMNVDKEKRYKAEMATVLQTNKRARNVASKRLLLTNNTEIQEITGLRMPTTHLTVIIRLAVTMTVSTKMMRHNQRRKG